MTHHHRARHHRPLAPILSPPCPRCTTSLTTRGLPRPGLDGRRTRRRARPDQPETPPAPVVSRRQRPVGHQQTVSPSTEPPRVCSATATTRGGGHGR